MDAKNSLRVRVQGYFGGEEADDTPKPHLPKTFELVKDEYGRWINPNKKKKSKQAGWDAVCLLPDLAQ